jgi:2-oxoglutarate dehydrogenase E2 component (dihydrolipoamide succinyltransferase)
MSIEIKVPQLPESVADATIVAWHKKPGDFVQQDENLLDLETDKVVLEVPAPATGRLTQITKDVNAVVTTDEILGILEEGEGESTSSAEPASVSEQASVTTDTKASTGLGALFAGPAARREAHAQQVDLETVKGTGKAGRVTREDVQRTASSSKQTAITTAPVSTPANLVERVPMPRLRAKIAERLVMAQQQAAILTTFNEVNLKAVMDLRARYKDQFEKQHGVRLGFMSFFTKAVVKALKEFPIVNAAIEGNDIVYHHYYDIGIAVSTDRGLVVPVVRNADQLGFAEIEKTIVEYGNKARNGQISIDELTGGTFTITNGGIFGSLLSTPILNPPQSGILGMHKIEERAFVENGQVVVRPMMYIALSYDHRIIDGKESVQFLAMIKNLLEDPARLLLEV